MLKSSLPHELQGLPLMYYESVFTNPGIAQLLVSAGADVKTTYVRPAGPFGVGEEVFAKW
jgi:hypothetical protein